MKKEKEKTKMEKNTTVQPTAKIISVPTPEEVVRYAREALLKASRSLRWNINNLAALEAKGGKGAPGQRKWIEAAAQVQRYERAVAAAQAGYQLALDRLGKVQEALRGQTQASRDKIRCARISNPGGVKKF